MTDLGPYIAPYPRHYQLLQYVLDMKPAGTALEFGVATGTSTRLLAARMPVVGFDSFNGLPEDWRPGFPTGKFKVMRLPRLPNTDFVVGLFADTLPGFDFAGLGGIGLVHFDADLYSSTATALQHVGPHLRPGVFFVFDEFHSYPGSEMHEARAFAEYVEASGTVWEPVGHSHEAAAFRMAAP